MFEQDSIRCGVNPQRDLPIRKLGQVHILQRHDGHRQHEFGNEVIGGSHQLHNDRKVYDNYMDKNDRSSWDVFKEDIDQAVWKRFLRFWETVESPEFGIVSPESWKPYTESLETFSSISKTVLGNVFRKSFPRIFGTLFWWYVSSRNYPKNMLWERFQTLLLAIMALAKTMPNTHTV